MSSLVKGNLLQTYCCSWHGSQTWDMNSKHVCQLNVQWNKAVRRTLKITYTTHTRLLPHFVNSFSFKDQHARRVKKFLYTFTSSENMHVLFIGERALRNTIGALGRNRARIEISSNVSKSNSDQITTPTEGVRELNGSAWQCPANPWTHWFQWWNHGTGWFYIWWDILNNSVPLLWLEFPVVFCVRAFVT